MNPFHFCTGTHLSRRIVLRGLGVALDAGEMESWIDAALRGEIPVRSESMRALVSGSGHTTAPPSPVVSCLLA